MPVTYRIEDTREGIFKLGAILIVVEPAGLGFHIRRRTKGLTGGPSYWRLTTWGMKRKVYREIARRLRRDIEEHDRAIIVQKEDR